MNTPLTKLRRLIAFSIATVTRTPRYLIPWQPSASVVCTVFRVVEFIVGRRVGIRLEQTTDSEGNVYSFTLENYLVTWEGIIRGWFATKLKFKIVLIPELQLAGFQQKTGLKPYRFTIAFDVAEVVGGNPTSFNHTVTGTNPFLVVGCAAPSASSFAVTYNSVAMTFVRNQTSTDSNFFAHVYVLGNPSTGTNAVAASFGYYAGASSYSGAQSSSTVDSSNSGNSNTSGGTLTVSTTSVADNCWAVGWWEAGDRTLTLVTGTSRATLDNFEFLLDGNAAITPPGSTSLAMSWSNGNRVVGIIATIAPFSAPAVVVVNPARHIRHR